MSVDFKNKKVVIADVDDTICVSCQVITDQMAETINALIAQDYTFAFISGTDIKYLLEMVSSGLSQPHYLLATTGTRCMSVGADGSHQMIYEHLLSSEEKSEIKAALEKLVREFDIQTLTTKEDQIQDRGSQVTLSAIGRHAPRDQKKIYDPDGAKRTQWVSHLKNILNPLKYEMNIAGSTSVDITPAGLDKEWGIRSFAKKYDISHSDIIFFGDKLYPGGNDFPATKVVDCIAVTSPEDTLTKLTQLLS